MHDWMNFNSVSFESTMIILYDNYMTIVIHPTTWSHHTFVLRFCLFVFWDPTAFHIYAYEGSIYLKFDFFPPLSCRNTDSILSSFILRCVNCYRSAFQINSTSHQRPDKEVQRRLYPSLSDSFVQNKDRSFEL